MLRVPLHETILHCADMENKVLWMAIMPQSDDAVEYAADAESMDASANVAVIVHNSLHTQ